MTQRVMGMETEYAITGHHARGDSLDKTYLSQKLVQLAAKELVNLPSGDGSGLFLANGSRFYRDAGNHPELSTPECLTPWEVARYVSAGDRILHDLAQGFDQSVGQGCTVEIAKGNVDYSGSGSTWGCHESYSHQMRDTTFYHGLIPHLVTRIIYSGAGGFNSLSPGLEFALSPRVFHLAVPISGSSTSDRGIIHTKNEDFTGGTYNRLHLLCGESLYSQTASVLRIGTTALVVAMLEQGLGSEGRWHLVHPVDAMKSITQDPSCRVEFNRANGNRTTALEIQDHYLSLIENDLGADWLPDWAEDLCKLWRRTLTRLADAPVGVCDTLDWAIKHMFIEKVMRDRGFDAERLSRWNDFQSLLFEDMKSAELLLKSDILSRLLQDDPIHPQIRVKTSRLLSEQELDREELLEFLKLRRDLFMLDARFNTVGPDCIFASLQSAGVLNHEVPQVGDIAPAMNEAPRGTRAHLRGKAIKDLSAKKGENLCSWDFVTDQSKKLQLNLSDPFNLQEIWEPLRPRRPKRPRFLRGAGRSDDFIRLLQELDL